MKYAGLLVVIILQLFNCGCNAKNANDNSNQQDNLLCRIIINMFDSTSEIHKTYVDIHRNGEYSYYKGVAGKPDELLKHGHIPGNIFSQLKDSATTSRKFKSIQSVPTYTWPGLSSSIGVYPEGILEAVLMILRETKLKEHPAVPEDWQIGWG